MRVIAVGGPHEKWLQPGLDRYQKRLRGPWQLDWQLLPHSKRVQEAARAEESERITKQLDAREHVILLDERGQLLDSPTLSARLEKLLAEKPRVTLIVGGAYGVTDTLRARAGTSTQKTRPHKTGQARKQDGWNGGSFTWSLSPLVFPHQLVRLLLAEQIYRAQQIAHGGAYHHE